MITIGPVILDSEALLYVSLLGAAIGAYLALKLNRRASLARRHAAWRAHKLESQAWKREG